MLSKLSPLLVLAIITMVVMTAILAALYPEVPLSAWIISDVALLFILLALETAARVFSKPLNRSDHPDPD